MAVQVLPPKSTHEYKLKRDCDESMRLTTQHHVLTERQGWLLHPIIQTHLRGLPSPKIVDVATGNGVWATALAGKMPNASVTGLDISAAQFPAKWTWPKNTNFDLYDLLDDVPATYQHQFDVVHIRLILPAGPSVDSAVIIESLKKLLKPGGWLQWDDMPSVTALSPVPVKVGDRMEIEYEAPHPVILALSKIAKLEERTEWFSKAHERLRGHGFEDTQTLQVPMKAHLLKFESDILVTVKKRFAEMLIKSGYVEGLEAAEEFRKLVFDMQRQFDEGQMFSYNWFVAIGRLEQS